MPLFLCESDVERLLPMRDCIDAVEAAFARAAAGAATVHPRRRLHAPDGTFHFMEALDLTIGRAAAKVYASFRPATRFLVLLYDAVSGEMLAMIEADRLGQRRTGAATGVATRHMARADAAVLALFGAGWQAESQALAVAEVRALRQVRVYSRAAERRDAFARRMADLLGLPVIGLASPAAALDGADIVVTATSSREPVFDGKLLPPGVHVNAVGSNSLAKAEVDSTTVARAAASGRVVVDSQEAARLEAGDLLVPVETRRFRWEQAVELGDVVAGIRPGRVGPQEITLFKSVGVALEDLAAASLVYDRARAEGAGRDVPMWEP